MATDDTTRILHLLRTEPKNLDKFDHQQICMRIENHAKLRTAFENLCRIVNLEPAAVELYLSEEPIADDRVASAREDLRAYQDALEKSDG